MPDAPRFGRSFYHQVYQHSPASVGVTTLEESRFVEVNDGFEKILGYTPDQVLGRTVEELDVYADRALWKHLHDVLCSGESIRREEMRVRTRTGETRIILGAFIRVQADEGLFVAHKLVDITELRLLEQEVLEVSAREQRRIGQDLHDDLGQRLTGLAFLARRLQQRLEQTDAEGAQEAASIARHLVDAHDHARRLARALVPAELERAGLVGALEELSETACELYDIDCTVQAGDRIEVHSDAGAHLFRITQEAINNAARHGSASRVVIEVERTHEALSLRVIDDGSGIPDEALAGNHGLGLRTMRYRARILDAALEIRRRDEGGTLVECRVPPNRALPAGEAT
jgi:two-component system, LuxR family, sensor kinase FixL